MPMAHRTTTEQPTEEEKVRKSFLSTQARVIELEAQVQTLERRIDALERKVQLHISLSP